MLFCSICIQLSILKLLHLGCFSHTQEHGLLKIVLWVRLFTIHHRSFWELSTGNDQVTKLADMNREVVQEMHFHQVEIRSVDRILCNFWLDLRIFLISTMTLCHHRNIVPSRVSLLFLLYFESCLLFERFRDLLCKFTGTHSTETILVTMKHL